MLSSALRRAVRTSTAFPSIVLPSSVGICAPANSVLNTTTQRRAHQRRLSSSKPPAPPSDGSRPFDTSSPQTATGKGVGPAERDSEQRKTAKRKGKDSSSNNARNNHSSAFLNVPSVPSTHHLSPQGMFRLLAKKRFFFLS